GSRAAIRQARREGRCGDIGRAPQRTGSPRERNPPGPGAFCPRVRRRSRPYYPIRPSPCSCPRAKIAPAQTIQSGHNLLLIQRLREAGLDVLSVAETLRSVLLKNV